MPEIKVTAGYDGGAVEKGLNNLQKDLAGTATAANKVDSSLDALSSSAKKLGGAFDEIAAGRSALEGINAKIDAAAAAALGAGNAFEEMGNEASEAALDSVKSIEVLEARIESLNREIRTTTEPAALKRFNDEIKRLNTQISNLKVVGFETSLNKIESSSAKAAKGLSNIKTSSGQSAAALTDFNRIVQDSPFGIIGITNNITQFQESFSRLRASAGTTGGALKQLLGSLTGAGGIGFAISAITTAATFASVGFGAWTRGLKDNKKAVEDVKSAYDSVIKSLTEEQVKVDKIVVALENENLSRKERKNAIEQLQRIAPAYFSTLDKENATIGQITTAYNKFSQSIIRSIEARVREKELIDVTEKILKLRDKATKIGTDEVMINGKMVKVNRQRVDAENESLSLAEAYRATMKGTISLTTEENKELEALEKTRARILGLIVASTGADPFIETEKAAKKAKETISDVLAELAREIDFLNKKEIAFGTNETKAKLSAYFSTIEKLIKDFKVDPNSTLINKLFGTANDIKFTNADKVITAYLKTIKEVPPVEIPVQLGFDFKKSFTPEDIQEQQALAYLQGIGITTAMQDGINVGISALRFPQLIALAKSAKEQIAAVTSLLKESAVSAAVGIGEALGSALAGGGNFIQDALGGVFKIMGDFLVQLGKAAIITSELFLAIKASKTNPFTGIIGGIAAIAAGTILKNIKLPKFATGGTFQGGGSFLAGERGPEIITAPRGTVITPNAQTNAILGSGSSGGTVVFEIEGRKLVGVLQSASGYLNRNGQL